MKKLLRGLGLATVRVGMDLGQRRSSRFSQETCPLSKTAYKSSPMFDLNCSFGMSRTIYI